MVAGRGGSLRDAGGCRGACPHGGRDVCRAVSEQTDRPGAQATSYSRDEIVTAHGGILSGFLLRFNAGKIPQQFRFPMF